MNNYKCPWAEVVAFTAIDIILTSETTTQTPTPPVVGEGDDYDASNASNTSNTPV